MTIPHAVILTSIAWAIIATLLVAYEKWAARRDSNEWADYSGDLRTKADASRVRADAAEHRMHAAEIALRHYRQGVEAGVSHSVNTLNAARIAARDQRELPVPGSWKA